MRTRFKPKNCLLRRLPEDADPRVWLYAVLGPRRFCAFQKKFGGRRILVPKYRRPLPCGYCPQRTRCLKILRSKGLRPAQIGRRFGITMKHVYALLKPANPRRGRVR